MPMPVNALGKATVVFLILAIPVVAPIVRVDEAPKALIVVAFALKSVAFVFVVVISPPLTAISPAVVISPVEPVIEKLVAVTSFAPRDNALTISESDKSRALVIPPAPA